MKKLKNVILIILGVLLLAAGILLFLFRNELKSLHSIEKVDDYGMFQMTYYGDYGFDDFLKTGAKSDEDISKFVTKRLLKGLPIKIDVEGAGCSVFMCHDKTGNVVMGRNFDFPYSPSMQVYTKPDNGYASVSTVNLSFLGFDEKNLPSGINIDSFLALAAPFLPFDGMNEKGLAIALMAVPEVQYDEDPGKITLNTTTAIRLALDKAATVDEAVELLKQYNIYFSGDVYCHFLIADKEGHSVLVEYWDGKLQTVEPEKDYQIATNFVAYNGLNLGEGYTEFERYDQIEECLEAHEGCLTQQEAADLLAQTGVYGKDGEDKLQWSVFYNLSELNGSIFAHRKTDAAMEFSLPK